VTTSDKNCCPGAGKGAGAGRMSLVEEDQEEGRRRGGESEIVPLFCGLSWAKERQQNVFKYSTARDRQMTTVREHENNKKLDKIIRLW
jgi:hypothetical protein